jgi:hypothetical protein
LEFTLLFIYIVCFAIIVQIKTSTLNGSGLRDTNNVQITSEQFQKDLKNYFRHDAFLEINNFDEMYTWLETHLNDKLYLPVGKRSPNWPIGSTRMIQYRVKVNKTCDAYADGENL